VNKTKIYNFKLIFNLSFVLFFSHSILINVGYFNSQKKITANHFVFASEITASSSAEIAQEDQEKVSEILKTLEKVTKDKQKNQEIKADYEVETKKKGFIAVVETINEYTIKIMNQKEAYLLTRATLDQSATMIKNNQNIKTSEIEVGDWLIIMGFENDEGFQTRRMLVFKKDLNPPNKITRIGSIESLEKNQLTFINKQNNEKETYQFNTKTRWQNYDNFKANQGQFIKGLEVIFVIEETQSNYILTTVHSTVDLDNLKN